MKTRCAREDWPCCNDAPHVAPKNCVHLSASGSWGERDEVSGE